MGFSSAARATREHWTQRPSAWSAGSSKREAQAKLHLARTLGAEDAPEVGSSEDSVGQVEVGAIEQVEDLPPELELPARSTRRPRLGQREIDVRVAGTDHAVARRAPEGERCLQRERRRIEPALWRARAARQIRVAQLIGALRGTGTDVRPIDAEIDGERRAGLRDEDSIGAPAAEDRVSQTAPIFEEWELIHTAGDELIRVVEARSRPFAGL